MNYFNTLPLRLQLDQLGKCRFMDRTDFSDGVDKLKGKKGLSDAVKSLLGGKKKTTAPATPPSGPQPAQTTTQPTPKPKPQEKKPSMQDLINQILR